MSIKGNHIDVKDIENNNKRTLLKTNIFRMTLALVVTACIIIFALPRDGRFNYEFNLNKPWRYHQIIAQFDFPIYKNEATVKRERDSLLANFTPYFNIDKEVANSKILLLNEEYNRQLKDVLPSKAYLTYIEGQLRDVYTKGVISTEIQEKYEGEKDKIINIVNDNQAVSCEIMNVYTMKDAYNHIVYGDSVNYKPDVLRLCSINDFLTPNLSLDSVRTNKAKEELIDNYSWAVGMVQAGEKIVGKGDIVNQHTYDILESLRKETIKRDGTEIQKKLLLIGQVMFVVIILMFFIAYLELFRRKYIYGANNLFILFGFIVIYIVATCLIVEDPVLNIYVIPYAIMPIMISIFLDSRTALVAYIVTLLICSIILKSPYQFVILQFAGGVVSIFSLRDLYQRSQIFKAVVAVVVTYSLVYISMELIAENDWNDIDTGMFLYFLANGALVLLAYPLLLMIEKLFGFTSNVTLVELSNPNNKLLRELSENAPGTFQHSLQVGNIASEAANRIGANSQLIRTAALYHDIGKMKNPSRFTENQSGGYSPYKDKSPEECAKMIIEHVTDGVEIANKYKLPQLVRDFISTHHGKSKPMFFYIKWKNEHPGEQPNDEAFSYPGPDPFTREQALLMMADAIEATSRSLNDYTEETISEMVERIVNSQVESERFKNCPITFKDIEICKEVFKEKLKIIYHTRIAYPKEIKK